MVFAKLADIICMDAWLPKYSKEWYGYKFVLVRSPKILAFIQRGIEKKEINVSKVPIEKIIKSQEGVLNLKRNQLSYRLYIALQEDRKIPEKVSPEEKIGILKERRIKLKAKM